MAKSHRLARRNLSETNLVKDEIQAFLREIVMRRDGGCILRTIRGCGAVLGDSGVVFQADHLIERSNSATYADSRLVVCVCKGCHGWKHFKKSNHDEYDAMVRSLLPKERVELWDRCRATQWKPTRMFTSDWKKELAVLKQELAAYG